MRGAIAIEERRVSFWVSLHGLAFSKIKVAGPHLQT